MKLTGLHLLLTYQCNFECDHCFVWGSPWQSGTMSLKNIRHILKEAQAMEDLEWIYFEGGEPFLYYPSMLEGIRLARDMGFKVGIVTNAYGAISEEDAEVWLRPLAELGVGYLSISDDSFHYGDEENSPAKKASAAAQRLGIPTSPISIQKPFVEAMPGEGQDRIKDTHRTGNN